MKFAVMGAGDIGARNGALLSVAGHDVSFIARGKRLEDIKANGLETSGQFGTAATVLREVNATDDPAEIGPVDVVILGVKTYQLEAAVEQMKPLIEMLLVLV